MGCPICPDWRLDRVRGRSSCAAFDAVLFDGDDDALLALARELAERDGPIVTRVSRPYRLDGLVRERSISTNTAAAGGNASLMAIG